MALLCVVKRMARPQRGVDLSVVVCMVLLLLFGLVVLFSATYYTAQDSGDALATVKKQLVGIGLGAAACFVLSCADYRIFMRPPVVLAMLAASAVLLVLVLVPGVGVYVNGSRRWLNLAGLSFQPSEFAKFAMVAFMAGALTRRGRPCARLADVKSRDPLGEPMSDVLERFMRYVQVDSQSDPDNMDVTPSTTRQHEMARFLGDELREIGCADVVVDEHAYVTGTLPASAGAEKCPALLLCAHIDSSPDAPAAGVRPHVVHYEGGPLVAGVVDGEPVQTTPDQVPDLAQFVGQDIVCTDGTTLLSADDKAGVAEI